MKTIPPRPSTGPEAREALPPDLIDSLGHVWRYGVKGPAYAIWNPDVQCWGLWGDHPRSSIENAAGPVREVPHGTAVTA